MFESFVIFGGCGFIGSHMQRLLREKYPDAKVYVADLLADGTELSQKVDVREPIEMQGKFGKNTLVFNFAAIHRTPGHPDHAYFETNIRGAENVCNFARKHGIENIVFTSSIAPYGAAEELKTEETLPTPNTPYGISKLVAEKIHREWAAENENHRQPHNRYCFDQPNHTMFHRTRYTNHFSALCQTKPLPFRRACYLYTNLHQPIRLHTDYHQQLHGDYTYSP